MERFESLAHALTWHREVLPEALQTVVRAEERAEHRGVDHENVSCATTGRGIQIKVLNSRSPLP